MKEKKTEIFINSNPENVWKVLTNLDGWKAWNPIIREVTGEMKLGNKLKVTIKAGKSGTVMNPVISKLEDQKSLVWTTSMGAGYLFKNEKVIELSPSGEGTKVTHSELYGGLLPTLTWKKFEKMVLPMLNAANKGLKKEVENGIK